VRKDGVYTQESMGVDGLLSQFGAGVRRVRRAARVLSVSAVIPGIEPKVFSG